MQSLTPSPTDDLRAALDRANDEAARRHGNYADVEHLLLGLLSEASGPARSVLTRHGINTGALYQQVADAVGMERPSPAPVRDFSRAAKAVLARTASEAKALGSPAIHTGHLLLALMGESDGVVHEVLSATPLVPENVRAFLRDLPAPAAAASTPLPPPSARRSAAGTGGEDQPEFVLVPVRPGKKRAGKPGTPSRWGNWPLILAGLALFLVYLVAILPGSSMLTFVIVLAGWIFSVTLHEFAHALVAYLGGDHTVKDKGYLSFNPLKYTHPLLSIGLPLLFLAMGGIGLPGGAVYIERHRLKNKWWSSAVSAAGPMANLLLALILAAPFYLGLVSTEGLLANLTIWSAVAFLAMLQITAVILNLLPIPPLDGFGIIEPLLDRRTQEQFRQLGRYGLLLIFIILWTPLGSTFWSMIFEVCRDLQIPAWLISEGFWNFMFWRQPPQ